MDITEIVNSLKSIFEHHGISCSIENEWVFPNSKLPAIRALWHPREHNGRLDIHVLVEEGVLIEECFAGIGMGNAAYSDALHNFMVNSLHVLLAAFWNVNDHDQVLIEQWAIGDEVYTAYIGNIGSRQSENTSFKIPQSLFTEIEKTIKRESLHKSVHWVRTFFCNVSGQQTFESLLDNEEWVHGLGNLKEIPWEVKEGYYSIRNFIILRKLEKSLIRKILKMIQFN